jgi:IclR family transcriptional regulator, acetate operon repressor
MLKVAARTLDLYEAFARARSPLTLSELAREIDVAPSSCFELIGTLRDRGYLYGLGERRAFYPTRRMMDNVIAIAEHEPHVSHIAPRLERLRNETQETVILGRQHGDGVVYLTIADGPQTVRYTARVGEFKPLHSSAIGKVILSAANGDERRAWIERLPRKKMTDATLCHAAALTADIEAGVQRGYQMTRGENVADVMALAMPLRVGGDLFGVCVAGPMHRMSVDQAGHVAALRATVAELEEIP